VRVSAPQTKGERPKEETARAAPLTQVEASGLYAEVN